jgi:hypothetical protein
MFRPLPLSHLTLLFIAYRIAALLLYRPGGLIATSSASPYYFLLNFFPGAPPFLAPVLGALFMLPFELVTLYAIAELTRKAGQPKEANRRALWWAISPLSLWVFLTGNTPVFTAAGLGLLLLLRQGRRTWLMAAIFLFLAAYAEQDGVRYAALLLPLIILLVPAPAPVSALFAWGVLLAGPFADATEVTGIAKQAFDLVFWLAVAPALLELGYMIMPMLGWERWSRWIWRGAATGTAIASIVAIFILLPPDIRAARLEKSPLAPALAEMSAAPSGWFLSDDADVWEQMVGLGIGDLETRLVTLRNVESLRATLREESTSVWVLDSTDPRAFLVIEPLVEGFYIGEPIGLRNGTILRRYVSDATSLAPTLSLNALFEDGVTLIEARVPTTIQAGTLLPVELMWSQNDNYEKVFLHLIDANGTLVAQRDTNPMPSPDRHAIPIPATLAPGTYTLIVGRYNPATLERLMLSQGGDTMTVTTIEIVK